MEIENFQSHDSIFEYFFISTSQYNSQISHTTRKKLSSKCSRRRYVTTRNLLCCQVLVILGGMWPDSLDGAGFCSRWDTATYATSCGRLWRGPPWPSSSGGWRPRPGLGAASVPGASSSSRSPLLLPIRRPSLRTLQRAAASSSWPCWTRERPRPQASFQARLPTVALKEYYSILAVW